jgi:hypothetical protein
MNIRPKYFSTHVQRTVKVGLNVSNLALPMVTLSLINLLSIPLIISKSSLEIWNEIVVAQAIGSIGAIVIGFGWGVSGPVQVGTVKMKQAIEIFSLSVVSKIAISFFVAPICLAITLAIVGRGLHVILGCLGSLVLGFSSSWFFVGKKRYKELLWLDTCPRVILYLIGIMLCMIVNQINALLLMIFLGGLTGSVLPVTSILKSNLSMLNPIKIKRVFIFTTLSNQKYGFLTVLLSSVYVTLPIILVQVIAPIASPAFNLGLKIVKLSTMLFIPISQFLQGWIVNSSEIFTKLRIGNRITLLSTICITIFTFLFGQRIINFVSSGNLFLSSRALLTISAIVFLICMTQFIGLTGLFILKRGADVPKSTFLGAVIGSPLTALLAHRLGAQGALLGILVSEFVVFAWQFTVYLREMNNPILLSISEATE